jgi:chromosomal replication initiator protein
VSEQLRFEDEDIPITLRRAWDRALRALATRVNKPTFEAHIRTLKPLELTDSVEHEQPTYLVTLGVPTAFTREWVEKRHAPTIQTLLEEILDRNVQLRFLLIPREVRPQKAVSPPPTLFDTPPRAKKPESEPPPLTLTPVPHKLPDSPRSTPDAPELNPRYTFNNFVTGPTNRLAHSGAIAVAQSPGSVYNPLFLYGPPGLGKTHLMHAIGNQLREVQHDVRVAYVSAEAFTSSFQASLREKRTEAFRRNWRGVDVFLVDDIQFLAGKEYTREEFFHVFNEMYQMGKQIVICADRSPRDLRTMDERLRSRFESGLIADIAPPDLETRLAILHKKAEAEGMRIPDEVLLYMARLVQSNIRTLEGALVKLIAYASLVNSPVTTQLAADILERYYIQAGIGAGLPDMDATSEGDAPTSLSMMASGLRGQITPELIQRIVARRFNMSVETLTGRRRDRETALARQIAMHLSRELTELSLPGIGQVFGGKDHTTVMHACERIKTQMPLDDNLDTLVRELATQIRAQAMQ